MRTHASDPFAPPSDPSRPAGSLEVDPAVGPWRTPSGAAGFTSGSVGPAACAHCGSKAVQPEPIMESLGHMPWYGYLALLLGGVPLLIAHFSLYRRATVGLFLCPEHAAQRARRRLVKPVVLGALLVGVLLAVVLADAAWLLLPCLALLALAAYVVPRGRVRARRIDGAFVEVSGCADAYTARLPAMPTSMLQTLQTDVPDLD